MHSFAQMTISAKIDTSKAKTLDKVKFIESYLNKNEINKDLWHPKYQNKEVWDYSMDWIWNRFSPKKITTLFDIELVELQQVNDTLSYFKISAKSKPEKLGENFTNVYKYYIVEINGKYFLDNCKEYDQVRFKEFKTKSINFYTSPFLNIKQAELKNADREFRKLNLLLKRPKLTKPIDYYMCATEEELNNLSNIVVWNGGLGGYTNIPEGFIVAIGSNPNYQHEFVHAILGQSANCFFLQEGMASLYGGMDKGTKSYEQGIAELKDCYAKGNCNFDKLYAREVDQKYSSSLTYAFAAVCCKYLIENYGLEYFYKIYYDKEITTANFLEKVSVITGKSQAELKKSIEALILK
ncbi:hypothetical protein [Pedobacter sp. Hv1]|uniref:hypothetical protein n=1 Tax=Pedobacter sp. Hv1 TaxID=1740090 RepID=UPI0006D8B0E8|nr:hypothetical protein [Pedobacter sp. Hv1]KQC01815.1 hypothetical protein AQF98_05470 [Pedobacter sp. Hv1]